jgi:outer membrane protein assembly factor BamB
MTNQINSTSKNTKTTSQWYHTAVTVTVIGGIFSLIALELMLFNYFQRTVAEPKREEKLEALKTQLHQQPDDQQLVLWIEELDLQSVDDPNRAKELGVLKTEIRDNPDDQRLLSRMRQLYLQIKQDRIRQLDLQIRQVRLRRWDFSQRGSYILLGSLAVLLIGFKSASAYKKKPPSPQAQADKGNEHVLKAWSRWAVTVVTVVLCSTAIFLTTKPWIDFTAADTESTSYPSMEEIRKNWPRFRGPGGLGVSAYTNIPASWNGKKGEGIIWKTKVPLPGHNSPIVWEDRVFVTGADPNIRVVFCFDGLSGKLLWTGDVKGVLQDSAEPLEVMEDTGYAASTAVTDGRRVCAIFATGDVGCFDFEGKKLWNVNLGVPDSAYGYASSLAMYRTLLLIQYDHGGAEDGKSKLVGLDMFTGRTVWETKRPVPNGWSSPIVIEAADQAQIITCGDPWVIAYNPTNGAEIWRAKCLGGEIAPSPIYAGGQIFVIEPYSTLVAIKPDGRGDVTKTHIAWIIEESTPDISCPVSNGESIFMLTTEGFLTCYKTADGKKVWEHDLEQNFLASPSLVAGRLYMLDEKGVMYIAEAGTEYKELAKCELGEECFASPAFMDGRIYIRGMDHLYCIGSTD